MEIFASESMAEKWSSRTNTAAEGAGWKGVVGSLTWRPMSGGGGGFGLLATKYWESFSRKTSYFTFK